MFFFRLLSYLPLSVLYLFSDMIYLITGYVISYRKKVIDENLKFAFPEKSEATRKKIRNQFYRNLTDSFFAETIKMLSVSEKELRERMHIVNQEIVDAEVLKGKSTLMLAGHMFNWELAILSIDVNTQTSSETVYLKLNNPFFDRLMLTIRTKFGGKLTEKKDFRKSMITMRSQPRIVQLAADQRPPGSEKRYLREFLNRPAYFFEGAEYLAKKMDLPVFYAHVIKVNRGKYRLEFEKIAEPPYDAHPANSITDEFCMRLEKNIKAQPELYLWSHKRWKM
jgi:Kdo2-lipid IVA lauroyltransferase/acyltransferase